MSPNSVDEYQGLRQEIQSLKDCITQYIEFVVGGTGVVAGAVALVPKEPSLFAAYAVITLVLAIIETMIAGLLFYKFHSHNRYVGYCKLLAQEFYRGLDDVPSIHIWEPCVARLRQCDVNPDYIIRFAKDMEDQQLVEGLFEEKWSEKKIKQFSANPKGWNALLTGFKRSFQGLGLFARELLPGRGEWSSWEFPIHVTAVLFTIQTIFFLTWLYLYVAVMQSGPHPRWFNLQIIAGGFLVLCWGKYFGRLYTLMKGASNVDTFCWKFMVIRYDILKSLAQISPIKNEPFKYSIIAAAFKDVSQG